MFMVIMCQDTSELICFKLGMMLNTTQLYTLIPDRMILMFLQGHGVKGKVNLYGHSVVKLHEATEMFVMVVYVGKLTVKKSC